VDILKTTLGPRGMDKLIHQGREVTITNDGATVLQKLSIVHPAAEILVDISNSQDYEVGDGTTTVCLITGELLNEARMFIEDDMHSRIIIKG
jgi:T-complex protein 1 subunit eta